MPWQMLWPEFVKKRLCRYLLQHYLGHFFKEKISLEQLSIDIYNGTGCVKNLNLDCDALNEQINSASSFTSNNGGTSSSSSSSSSTSSVPIEIVSGFVGYISVYIPWHDLFNDYCKLTIKNVQITIRTKQRKPKMPMDHHQFGGRSSGNEADDLNLNDDSNSNPMFSSMFIDSIMNTSMHIAQECMHEQEDYSYFDKSDKKKADEEDADSKNSDLNNMQNNSLPGLEAFKGLIDSILSRIKINLEQIQIRIENLDSSNSFSTFKLNDNDFGHVMSSSTLFNNKPSNGIALELRIKSIKYFDLDSANQQQNLSSTSTSNTPNSSLNSNEQATMNSASNPARNTTKSFNIEGLTIYFDEFIIKDDNETDLNDLNSPSQSQTNELDNTNLTDGNVSLNATVDLSNTTLPNETNNVSASPQDESAPFNYELNPNYYLYTNPIICLTFSGIQSIKLTINNLTPTDLILEATADANNSSNLSSDKLSSNQQRPLLELSAQFGSIKCLLCPKQIHLLTEMFTKLNDYIEAANATKKAIKAIQMKKRASKVNKPIRGCDKRKFESLIQNDLVANLGDLDEEQELLNDDEDNNYKSIMITNSSCDNEASVMFYSMMSESTVLNSDNVQSNFNTSSASSRTFQDEKSDSNEDLNELDDDKMQVLFTKQLKQTIEQLKTDVIVANNTTSSNNRHNLFQTFKLTFRMFSLTVLHHDPPVTQTSDNSKQKYAANSNTNRLIVDRMKHISDNYFDWVSTIDTSSASTSQSSIDKNIIKKYHQACAFNDHFLILMKPINFNMIEKINQRNLSLSSNNSGKNNNYFGQKQNTPTVQYSLNDILLTIGYIQLNEYLVAEQTLNDKNKTKASSGDKSSHRFKVSQIMEASRTAIISEIIHFVDSDLSKQQNLEHPCFKLQFVMYEPLDLISGYLGGKSRGFSRQHNPMTSSTTTNQLEFNLNIQNQLLSRQFSDVCITLNQCLVCELDISIVDRLYYLINDVSKISTSNKSIKRKPSTNIPFNHQNNQITPDTKPQSVQNFEIKSNQIIKLALRFPIADLRRASSTNNTKKSTNKHDQNLSNVETSETSEIKPKLLIARSVTMAAFRRLRDQILTLHIFDFYFQTLVNSVTNHPKQEPSTDRQLSIICSQINAYYQYSGKERPIHFGLIQQKANEYRTLVFCIKLPLNSSSIDNNSDDCQTLVEEANQCTSLENDSLKQNFNINVSKANKFFNQTIKEENENEDSQNLNASNHDLLNDQKLYEEEKTNRDNNNGDDDDDDDATYGPFSRTHSLISSEKNRRIVNAGNKSEMNMFINQSRLNSQTVIKIQLPQLRLLIADQKFLNDIYNCFLNDLIMWVPSQLPPIESSLNLYDPSAAAAGFMVPPSLNYLIGSNFDADYLINMNRNRNEDTDSDEKDNEGKQFHMCRSAILKSPRSNSESENSDNCESDDDKSKRKYQQKYESSKTKQQKKTNFKEKKKANKNTLCVIVNIEVAHLKAFVINNMKTTETPQTFESPLKYGEFDIKTNNFNLCIAISENLKTDVNENNSNENKSSKRKSKSTKKSIHDSLSTYKIEKQYISLFTDQINISHSTKTCPINVTQLKYPTNYSSFEQLFQMSKTKDLITANDPSVINSLFVNEASEISNLQSGQALSIPMVSIGIKSKFNTKTNTKQLLVALNFNNLSLHHTFCAQTDYWIFQLILLFDLIDIDIIGYEVPIVLTELHLNVSNSCILYKPIYLQTRSLIAFKSLHWSSNVTAESSLTLLVFNIEDIYLFLSKQVNSQIIKECESTSTESINLKRDYICVANSDLFELRLLISDEESANTMEASTASSKDKETLSNSKIEPRKSPLLDIKIRSKMIQLRTCVDSAFTLIELINYIVSDGDLHQINPIMSEFMAQNSIPSTTTPSIEPQQPNVVEELSNAIASSEYSTPAITIPKIQQQQQQTATFTVGTPPPSSSFKSSSSSTSLNYQQFYSPIKHNSSSSSHLSAAASFQDNNQNLIQQIPKPIVPISSPSLSFNHKKAMQLQQNTSSSAESLISDMVKEAIQSNPMTQSIIGSLDPVSNSRKTNPLSVGGRKRNTSLNLPSPDLQTKRMLNRKESFDTSQLNNSSSSTLKATILREKNLNSKIMNEDNESIFDSDKNLINFNDNESDENKENNSDDNDDDDDHIANSLIKSIDREVNNRTNKLDESDQDSNDGNEFSFDLPFSDMSPFSAPQSASKTKGTSAPVQRQLQFDKHHRKLFFKANSESNDEDDENNENVENSDDDDDDKELLRDFDVIDVLPGFGEPPRNNQDFEIKILKNKTAQLFQPYQKHNQYRSYANVPLIEIKEDHFKKPLTKIDVLKAPDSYPCPLNVYCIQEISINWCLYGGSDFGGPNQFGNNDDEQTGSSPATNCQPKNRMNRTVSSPIIVSGSGSTTTVAQMPVANSPSTNSAALIAATRSRNNSTSSNSLSISPHSFSHHYQSPPKQQLTQVTSSLASTSPSSLSTAKFSTKSASVNFTKEKYLPRKAGGRIINKYDTNSLNWLARGGKDRNLDVCMEIALHKVKTKIDLYADMNKEEEVKEEAVTDANASPYLYRVALAIGDIEIRDKLTSSAFNMFLFRYESEHCPKHSNSNMIFLKFLCSKSMDTQRLLECDIKLSIQPLRFNIDQDALIFLVEFFTKMASKDLNEFSKTLVPPPPPILPTQLDQTDTAPGPNSQTIQKTPQDVFIRNFIFSPDLLVKFDFSGKYDKRPDTKMDTLTKLLMVAIQLSNTEIKLKRIYYRRGFLGGEKLLQALIKEWISDIQRNQMKNLIKGWGIFNSLIQFFEGFTYLIWYPIEQYRKDGRVLCGIQKGSAAFSTCTVLATIELTNRMFQATKNVAEFFYDLVTPHRANSHHHHNLNMLGYNGSSSALVETLLTGVGNNRNIRLRRQPNDIREGLTNAYYVMYEGMNDTAANFMQEINQGAEHKGLPGAIGGALRQLPSAALAPIVLGAEATCNVLSGIRNQLKPDEKKDDDRKWKTINN